MPSDVTSASPIFIISGTLGSGKSTVSAALMKRYEFGLHMPVDDLRDTVGDIIAGRLTTQPSVDPLLPRDQSHAPELLGLIMVPDVLESTPAFVDAVRPGSSAATAGLRPDDLILLVGGARVNGQAALRRELRKIDRRDDVSIIVQRGSDILPIELRAP